MKRIVSVVVGAAVLVALAGVALAFMGPRGIGMGGGMMGMGAGGGMGHGMGRGMGGGMGMMGTCPGMAQAATATQITEEKAKTLAQEYADKYLKGFTVDKVLPFTGPRHTMYSVELKGPNDEIRVLHVNPWGNVMPFGGPGRRPA
jgi:hypothetical protein